MWRVTHQVHLPTIALGLLWIVHSAATTMYVPWQNARQRTALASVVANSGHALELHQQLTELGQIPLTNESAPQRSEQEAAIAKCLAELDATSGDVLSRKLLISLRQRFESEREQHGNVAVEAIATLLEECQQLIRAEQQQLLTIVDQRSRTDLVVMVVRAILLVLGLMVGIGLAMWIARGLRQSLSEISVTLKGAEGDLRMDLGRIDIVSQGAGGELKLLESQVQSIVEQVHRVAEELQQTRQDMVRAERLAAVGELAASVAHEIRNPLTSVKLLVQRAAERRPVHSLNEEQLQVLLEEVSRIESTVQGLLDFARPEKSHRSACPLSDVLQRTLLLLDGRIQQQRIRIVPDNTNPPLIVCGDARLIQQVLVNLILNAIEFMPSGGDLIVRQHFDDGQQSGVLEIEDTGPGIAPGVLGRLFEPFVTTRSNGSGLGLAISRRMIEEQGGTLTARNSPRGGAIFQVQLPLATERSDQPSEALAP